MLCTLETDGSSARKPPALHRVSLLAFKCFQRGAFRAIGGDPFALIPPWRRRRDDSKILGPGEKSLPFGGRLFCDFRASTSRACGIPHVHDVRRRWGGWHDL
jgi:hypothetical protein